jgi:hypothetical protein
MTAAAMDEPGSTRFSTLHSIESTVILTEQRRLVLSESPGVGGV